jgi:small ligand-binding sensory domain FIST
MQYSSYLSEEDDSAAAVDQILRRAVQEFGVQVDLAFVYASHHHRPWFDRHIAELHQRLNCRCWLGCTGEAIVGTGLEIEERPALSVWLARCPQGELLPMRLEFSRTSDGAAIVGWPKGLLDQATPESALIMLAEPFSFPADYALQQLNDDRPDLLVLGGMASGATQPSENQLYLDGQVHSSGAVAVLLSGITMHSIVSQGCRPIGEPLVITRADQNVIFELGGKPALRQLRETLNQLPNHEQQMVQQGGIHVGRVVNEYQDRFEPGDFLVRNVTGFDPDQGALAIGDFVRPGQTIQFHIRDEGTASDELRQLLTRAATRHAPQGALLFTCNGRGTRMFSQEHHDASMIQQCLGNIPLAGFFAQGELGPVGGKNFVHGFTASVALFGQ